MVQLNLDTAEQQALSSALKSYVSNMSYEIADTDRKKYRDALKVKRDLLQKILNTLENTSES